MTKFTIWHDRQKCIGCTACAVAAPEYWEMDYAGDGRADLRGSKKTEKNGIIVKEELQVDDVEPNKKAADNCPVNVIHIIDNKTKKQII